jgi:hypothetical protein
MSFVFIKNIKKLFGTGVVLGIIAGVLLCGSTIAYAQVGGLSDVGANSGLSTQPLGVTIGKIVSAILGFLGIVSFIIIFYAGFLWMTARGNEDQVERAKAVMRNGLIGLIIILTSYSLTQFVLSRLLSATNNVPPHCFNGTLDGDETAVDCGGSCGSCGGGGTGGPGDLPGSAALYIVSLPASGDACVRNVHPTIIFNREVDISTFGDAIFIKKKGGVGNENGVWKYGDKKNVTIFEPAGDCGGGESGCLEASTEYTLTISTPTAIKSLVDSLVLNCTLKAGCGPVDFKTGSGVDRVPPTISILSPAHNTSVPAGGSAVPVKLQYSDDSGIQSIALYQNANLITSQSISGCRKSGTLDLNWPTSALSPGVYTLQGEVVDWAAHSATTSSLVRVTPFHCYNDVLESDLGEIEKGPPGSWC